MAYHRHPPDGEGREPWQLVSPEEVLDDIDALVAEEQDAGRL